MPSFLTTEDAAKAAHCSVFLIRAEINAGHLKAYKPAKTWLIEPEELSRWVKTRKVKPRAKKNGPA